MSEDLEKKLATARTKLILDKPFLGALVLRLPMLEAKPDWCQTTFSDGKALYYNRQYIEALNADQTQFALAHETLHCALSHFARRAHRVKQRWEMACDLAINPILIQDGLTPTPDALFLREYEGLSAEEIYPCLKDNDNDRERELEQNVNPDSDGEGEGAQGDEQKQKEGKKQTQRNESRGKGEEDGGAREENSQKNNDSDGQGASQPEPLTQQEIESLAVQWQQRMASAAQQAIQAGKLGGAMARMVGHMLQPRLPWRMLLARYLSMVARDDYSYSRPSNRRGDPAVYPSLRSAQVDIVVAVDTSGSISNNEIAEFIGEIDAIKSYLRARISLLACDAKLADGAPWCFEPWEKFELPQKFSGGGGTRFEPVFDWAAQQDRQPDLLVYFTDAQGRFPKVEPGFPVIWLVKGKTPVPWGQRVQLN